jgi:hypothetical protein
VHEHDVGACIDELWVAHANEWLKLDGLVDAGGSDGYGQTLKGGMRDGAMMDSHVGDAA